MQDLFGNRFSLVMLNLRNPSRHMSTRYQQAFAMWEPVWQGVQKRFNLTGGTPLLDTFLRHDEAACIFEGDVCAAILLFRTVDFSILDFRKDSYFKEWTELDIARLRKQGSSMFTGTYLTVNPEFRGANLKAVLMNIMVRRFHSSDVDLIVNIARRDRGLHDEAFGLGGKLIRSNVEYFSGQERVDFVYYTQESAQESSDPKMTELVTHLWETRKDWQVPVEIPAQKKKAA